MRNLIHKAAIATTLGTLIATGFAQAATALPPVHKSGDVEYLSGGIGRDESAAIEHASKGWPLTLEFAVKEKRRDEFAAGVRTIVRDAKGHAVLQTDSEGPFLLAGLEPGQYAIDATLAGKTLHEKVDVKRGQPAKAVFVWPAGTNEGRSS
jgi:hypothetical protein